MGLNQVKIGFNQVWGEEFGGGSGQRGRCGRDGPVAPTPKIATANRCDSPSQTPPSPAKPQWERGRFSQEKAQKESQSLAIVRRNEKLQGFLRGGRTLSGAHTIAVIFPPASEHRNRNHRKSPYLVCSGLDSQRFSSIIQRCPTYQLHVPPKR